MDGHTPVLLKECIELLDIKAGGVYIDGTLGMGGHSEAILKRLGPGGRLAALDRDPSAVERAGKRLSSYGARFTAVHANFRDLDKVMKELGIEKADGMLFDLGVSSPQLDEAERGFSYMSDAPLDMRMDNSGGTDAAFIINRWPEKELARIFREYGEERYASRAAAAVVRARESGEIKSTLELAEIIRGAMPPAALREKQHPAKRCFQAVRIAVNDELSAISEMMEKAPDLLRPGGRLAVISFHSLEDRIVKNAIQSREHGCTCPREAPVCTCGFVQSLRSVTRRPVTAGAEELADNPRSRSAKLRVAERI